jgi:dephospho-CoA kinase
MCYLLNNSLSPKNLQLKNKQPFYTLKDIVVNMIYGITGIFGCGKSTVAKLFKGYRIINADKIGHKLLDKKPIKDKIIKKFGIPILTKNKIDRKKLKNIVFYNHKELIKLNKIIHPYLIKEIKYQIKRQKKAVVDAALLIELKLHKYVDKVIVVRINKEKSIKRVLNKKKYNKKEINNIFKLQLSQKEKLKYADIVVDNSKSLTNTRKQIGKIR